ncbi:MAG TPA: fibronectin type III domain-containing protein [Gemmatimonadales bacterium]|nr:fibronectin type III domain-containing protein [Gemmatimonadales bacterium]
MRSTPRFPSRRLLTLPALLLALGAAACGDDSDGCASTPTAAECSVPLTAPAGVQASAASATSVKLTWTAVSGATGYVVQRAPGAGGDFAQVGTTAEARYTDAGIAPTTAYRYRVLATADGRQGPASDIVAVTTPAAGAKAATIAADITADRTLYADTLYTLSGFVHVANGATLTIQPGTVIQGDYQTLGSSLFILRGAKLMAVGTAEQPIVFTSSRPVGQRQPGDWGGLVLVGNAKINRGAPVLLEGTNTDPSKNPGIDYAGGTDDGDSSGELRYVRVEFAGYAPVTDAELNSFTFAAVGSGTRVSHLQALGGLDDAYEFFGGTMDADHLVSYETGDDHFDMSEGYQGRLQYLIAYQTRVLIPRPGAGSTSSDPQGIENDGCAGANCTSGQNSMPHTIPLVANFTLVGTGPGVVDATSGGVGMMLRRGTGGYYVNGVLGRWPRAGLSLRDAATNDRLTAGELAVQHVLLSETPTLFQASSGSNVQYTVDPAANALEQSAATTASLFAALPSNPTSAAQLDWTPAAGSAAASGGLATFGGALQTKAGTTVAGTSFRGAADPAGTKWWAGWTSYADN